MILSSLVNSTFAITGVDKAYITSQSCGTTLLIFKKSGLSSDGLLYSAARTALTQWRENGSSRGMDF